MDLLQPLPPLDWKEHDMRGHITCHGSVKPIAQNSTSQTCYRLQTYKICVIRDLQFSTCAGYSHS